MKEWILSIFCTVFICALINMILPEGRLGKYVKHTFSIIVMLVMVQPFLSININFLGVDGVFSDQIVEYQDSYLDYVTNKKVEALEEKCVNIFLGYDIVNLDVNLDYEFKDNSIIIKNVKVNLTNAVINSDKEHIDIIGQAKKSVAEFLKIAVEDVIVYE